MEQIPIMEDKWNKDVPKIRNSTIEERMERIAIETREKHKEKTKEEPEANQMIKEIMEILEKYKMENKIVEFIEEKRKRVQSRPRTPSPKRINTENKKDKDVFDATFCSSAIERKGKEQFKPQIAETRYEEEAWNIPGPSYLEPPLRLTHNSAHRKGKRKTQYKRPEREEEERKIQHTYQRENKQEIKGLEETKYHSFLDNLKEKKEMSQRKQEEREEKKRSMDTKEDKEQIEEEQQSEKKEKWTKNKIEAEDLLNRSMKIKIDEKETVISPNSTHKKERIDLPKVIRK